MSLKKKYSEKSNIREQLYRPICYAISQYNLSMSMYWWQEQNIHFYFLPITPLMAKLYDVSR